MKHKKSQCAIFIESRLPCEDCDLEGHSATCGWHIDWHDCSCGGLEEQFAKEISEMSDEEMKENVDKNFLYWQNRKAELQRCIDNNEIFAITEEDQKQEIIFLKQERERLIKKLEKIDNLSRYAWEQVKRNPQEAEELFKMINKESK
jgi:hypothetical protein